VEEFRAGMVAHFRENGKGAGGFDVCGVNILRRRKGGYIRNFFGYVAAVTWTQWMGIKKAREGEGERARACADRLAIWRTMALFHLRSSMTWRLESPRKRLHPYVARLVV